MYIQLVVFESHGLPLRFLNKSLRRPWLHYRTATSQTPHSAPKSSHIQAGGTLQLISVHTSGRVFATGSDDMGRWSFHTLCTHQHQLITIIVAYCVCQSSRSGPKTAAVHQCQYLIPHCDIDHPNPCSQTYRPPKFRCR